MDFTKSERYESAADKIKNSMTPYYDELDIEWDDEKKLQQFRECDLWDIHVEGKLIGFFMLLEKDSGLYLGELHIDKTFRNLGYGSQALYKIKKMASEMGYSTIRVGAFKTSPAYRLYLSVGFTLEREAQYTYELVANT